MRGVLLAVGAALLLAGCFSEILPASPQSGLQFLCLVLDPAQAERVVVHAWVPDALDLDVQPAHLALNRLLASVGARNGGLFLEMEEAPDAPRRGWNATTVREWADDELPLEIGDEVHLHVLWADRLDGGLSSVVAAPGVVAISVGAVEAGAEALGVPASDVARAVALHVVGHALGAVNLGVPIQDADLGGREGPPGHDPDPASVLHVGWEHAATMQWAANATYDGYGPRLRADWAAAVQPGGVCAA